MILSLSSNYIFERFACCNFYLILIEYNFELHRPSVQFNERKICSGICILQLNLSSITMASIYGNYKNRAEI